MYKQLRGTKTAPRVRETTGETAMNRQIEDVVQSVVDYVLDQLRGVIGAVARPNEYMPPHQQA